MKVLIILALAAIPCWLLWSHLKAVKAEDEARAARIKAAAEKKEVTEKKAPVKKKKVVKKKGPAKKRGRPRKKKKSENTDGKK